MPRSNSPTPSATLTKKLGEGLHGETVLASLERRKTPQAVKLLRCAHPDDPSTLDERLARLRLDLQRLGGDHTNLVLPHTATLSPFSDDPDSLALVTDFVDAPDLLRFCARGSWSSILEVTVSILRGLEALHARGIRHGHLVAANVLVFGQGPRKSARLLDPGLASVFAETRHDLPPSLAPEVTLGLPLDRRTDLYDLGVLLFHCLARTPLFEDADDDAHAHLTQTPPDIRAIRKSVPVALERLTLCLLHKDPDQRPPSANSAIRELNRLANKRFSTETREDRLTRPLIPALTGRQEPLQDLLELTPRSTPSQEPHTPLLVVSADPGQGRTRLLQELHRLTPDLRWIQPHAPTAAHTLRALLDLADAHGNEAPLATRRAALSPLLDPADTPADPSAPHLLEALAGLTLDLARLHGPLLLALDDIHRADPLLLDALHLVAHELHTARHTHTSDPDLPPPPADAPLLVLATLAPDELYGRPAEAPLKALLAADGVLEMPLEPLEPGLLADLLASALGRPPQDVKGLTSALADACPTPPLALSLLRALAEDGTLPSPDGAWTVDPERLQPALRLNDASQILSRRLDAQTPHDREPLSRPILEALALAGAADLDPSLPLPHLARTLDLPLPALRGALHHLEDRGWITLHRDRASLTCSQTIDAVLASLDPDDQALRHTELGRAAAQLAREHHDPELLERAARHLLRSSQPTAAAAWSLVAARAALAAQDPARAADLLDAATRDAPHDPPPHDLPAPLDLGEESPRDLHLQLLLLHSTTLLQLGRLDAARATAQRATALARESRLPTPMAEALLLTARASLLLQDPAAAREPCEEAVKLARGQAWQRGWCRALHLRARIQHRLGDRDQARTSCEEALAHAQALGDAPAQTEILRDLARLLQDQGDLTAALEAAERSVELADDPRRPSDPAPAARLRAELLLATGDAERAERAARDAAQAARESLDARGEAHALTLVARALAARGHTQSARNTATAALQRFERTHDLTGAAHTRQTLGQLAIALGDLDHARDQLARAATAFRTLDDETSAGRVHAALARVHLLAGDTGAARDALERAHASLPSSASPELRELQALRAEVALAQGDLPAAETDAAAAAEDAARQADARNEIRARLVLGETRLRRGQPGEADRELRDAFRLADQHHHPELRIRARLTLASAHWLRGEPASTIEEIQTARDEAQALQDAPLEVRSLLTLGRLSLRLGQRARASSLLDMGLQRARDLGLHRFTPEALTLQAQVALARAHLAPDPGRDLDGALELLDEATRLTTGRRDLRATIDATAAELLLLRREPLRARERAEAALEACHITGDIVRAAHAERLVALARLAQGRHESALTAADHAVNATRPLPQSETRAAALAARATIRLAAGAAQAAAQDSRDAASILRGMWAALPEDLREDYLARPLLRETIRVANDAAAQAEAAPTDAPPPKPTPAPTSATEALEAPPVVAANPDDGLGTLRDPLTDLFSHPFFTAQLDTEVKRGLRHNRNLALLKVNVDRFKLVRELYGPQTAKRIIQDVGRLLLRNVRDVDLVARYFGDEFEILLPDTDLRGALLTAERIRTAAETHQFAHDDETLELTLTLGVAVFPTDAKDRDSLICRVDEALYNARSRGSNSVFAFGTDAPDDADDDDSLREVDQLMLSREGRTIASMVQRLVNQELDIDRVIELVTGMVVEATRGERGFILLRGPNNEFTFRHGRNIDDKVINSPELKISNGIAREVAETGQPIHVTEAIEDNRFKDFKSVMDLGLRSILCAPIRHDDQILGVLYVDHNQVARNFGAEDLNFLTAIADKVAVPIANSKKLQETEDRLAVAEARLRKQAAQLETKYHYENIVGRCEAMQKVFKLLDRIVETSHSVVIHGESGTGKELIARAIHYNGPRKTKPFVAENCAAINEHLLESELFGYVKGAFTGADRDTKGFFELANGGTLFLDEIGDMSERMQKKLLRVLQEGEVRPVGGKRVFRVDVRIISASNKDLKKLVSEGAFREDLYYRLNVITVNLPPLRERREDIVLLVEHFLTTHAESSGERRELDRETLRHMVNYDWPGNVRELENEVSRLIAMSDHAITPEFLSPKIREGASSPSTKGVGSMGKYLNRPLKAVEHEFMRDVITHALEQTNWHRTKAAKILDVPTSTLFNKMKKYGIG